MALEVITREPLGTPKPTPLLFVHGILHGAWCWDEYFLPYFAQHGYVASAVSLRGHAGSVGPWRWNRVHHYVDDVAEVAAQLEQKFGCRPVVIGHSMGGFTIQKYLENHAAPGGILVASAPTHGVVLAMFREMFRDPLGFLQINLTLNLRPVANNVKRARKSFFSEDMTDSEVLSHQSRMGNESYWVFMDMLLLSLPRPKRVKAPILVVAGETDSLFAVWEEQRLARAYDGACEVISATAHDVMLEKHWQVAADTMLVWLDKTI